jgi:hypothetical protein
MRVRVRGGGAGCAAAGEGAEGEAGESLLFGGGGGGSDNDGDHGGGGGGSGGNDGSGGTSAFATTATAQQRRQQAIKATHDEEDEEDDDDDEEEQGPGGAKKKKKHQQQQQQQQEAWHERTLRCAWLVRRYAANLAAVYFLEYVIQVAGASLASGPPPDLAGAPPLPPSPPPPPPPDWLHGGQGGDKHGVGGGGGGGPGGAAMSVLRQHSFALLALSYQLGVLVSRSLSLSLFPVRRLELLTAAQALLFAWWGAQARWLLWGLEAQVACMAVVGLMGGAMYVNVFALINGDGRLPEKDREFAINVVALAVNAGIVGASVFDLVAVPLVRAAQLRDRAAAAAAAAAGAAAAAASSG